MAAAPPAHIGVGPVIGQVGIAENALGNAVGKRLLDLRRRLKIHIGHGHGQLVFPYMPLGAFGVPPVLQLVKVIVHRNLLFYASFSGYFSSPFTIMRAMISLQNATAVAQWKVPLWAVYSASPSGVFQS